ncbi:type II DNA topoisomerase [Metschnikowia bicuspidata]|uniref:DNA topoisomerase 2 n=1 Tax=Metschnikowia bicuspidata TaxID=27322 RepID=A0A4P9ZBH4_9ASCO|nr:type II DNA topoisomerase [Metschnikowia bicuspidata]
MSDFLDEDFSDGNVSDDAYEIVPAQKKQKKPVVSTPPLSNGTSPANRNNNALAQYQKLSQLEHILKRPDTYIGSVELNEVEMWCFDQASELMKFRKVLVVPGLYKIFDEILVNAADNKIRDPGMKNIRVDIDAGNHIITVTNDGKGIPVEVHDKEQMWIPEMIFGNLLTSSNYDDDEKKVVGGRNGFGAKLCNIFSTRFEVETSDQTLGQLYTQTWTDNMLKVSKPRIVKVKNKKEYTKITFAPDLAKFSMTALDDDILSVLRRRVYDLCGTVRDCLVSLDGKKLPVRNFKGYVDMYVKAIQDRSPVLARDGELGNYTSVVHEVLNERWEIAFAVSDGTFNQVSFVNSIATTAGGTHVKLVTDQIVAKFMEDLKKKEKGRNVMIKPQQIKNNMFIFINSLIENPAFTSQTKEQLTTKPSQFSSKLKDKLVVSDTFVKKLMKTSIFDTIRSIVDSNEGKALQKDDGKRKLRIKGHVKLEDANKAGTKEGYKCTLLLTEGDSALSLAKAGFEIVGRDYYGCFPLRGKLLNVREASAELIAKNAEITALKKIIGLQHRKHYTAENIRELRYGHIMIMTDQDHDGLHIKGLLINFFEASFPGLLNTPGFLLEFVTPIVKVTIKGRGTQAKRVLSFYSMPEFEQWRDTEGRQCRWTQKYYKGLGTSTPAEAKEYFSQLEKHKKEFHALQEDDSALIDLAFLKKKADERKEWLQGFQPGTHLDQSLEVIPIQNFINEELILFSMADNVRSIPSVLDGFKPGQRKVLFGCFKKNLRLEIKNFIGSNNLNLLKPNGGFGTRAAGGKDYSAARYIFTEINEITRKVFNPADNALLTYVQDDEQTVEPEWYLPVIPMLLVNGSEGIGTGWSTNVPCFNPMDLVDNIRRLMAGEEPAELVPWYRGWTGEIERVDASRFRLKGVIEQVDEKTVEIREIPVKTWTNNMKEFLLDALNNDKNPWIKDMEEQHTSKLRFVVRMTEQEMQKTHETGMLERFKLTATVNLSNMVAFDPLGRIRKYDSPNDMLRDFYYVRLEYYQKQKDYLSGELQRVLVRLGEQARFIKMIIDKKLVISNRCRAELVQALADLGFVRYDRAGQCVDAGVKLEDAEELADENAGLFVAADASVGPAEPADGAASQFSHYDYLLGMPLWSLTREKYERLLRERAAREEELHVLLGKSAKDLWNENLDEFLEAWHKFLADDEAERSRLVRGSLLKAKKRRARAKMEEDDDYGQPAKKTAKKSAPKSRGDTLSAPTVDDLPTFFSKTAKPAKPTARKSKFFADCDDDVIALDFEDEKTPAGSGVKGSVDDRLKELGAVRPAGERKRAAVNYAVDGSGSSEGESAYSESE